MTKMLIIFVKLSIVFLLFKNVTPNNGRKPCCSPKIIDCMKLSWCTKLQKKLHEKKCLDLRNNCTAVRKLFNSKISCSKSQISETTCSLCSNSQISSTACSLCKELISQSTCLDLSNNKLETIGSKAFQRFPHLKVLDLGNSTLKTIDHKAFKGLSNLKVLNLSHNQIEKIQKNIFQALQKLKILDLSNSNLETIHRKAFNGLSNLNVLNLSHNQIEKIQKNIFQAFQKLKILDLTGNDLDRVDLSALPPTTKVFVISGCGGTSFEENWNCMKNANAQNPKQRRKNLRKILQSSRKLPNSDIPNANKELKRMLHKDTLNDTEAIEEFADLINEISGTNLSSINSTNAKEVRESVDLFARRIPTKMEKFQFTRSHIAIGIVNLNASGKEFKQYSMSGVGDTEINETNVEFDNDEDESYKEKGNRIGFIRLPKEAIRNSSNDRIQFKIFLNAQLFVSDKNSTNKSFINSAVISANVGSGQVIGLKKHVVVQLRHSQPMRSQSRVRCVFWDETEETWSDEGCWTKKTLHGSTVCSCNHLTNFALLMDIYDTKEQLKPFGVAFQVITYVGCILSLLGLLITLFTYGSVFLKCSDRMGSRDFRTLRKDTFSQVIFCLSLTMFIANIVFLSGTWHQENDTGCKVLAALLHFLFLSVMCWTAVASVYLYMTCIKVLGSNFTRFISKAALGAWGIPLIIVAVTLGINVDNYVFKQICWLDRLPFYGAFLAPIALILLANIFIFCAVIYQLRRQTKERITHGSRNYSVGTQIRGTIGLSVILGLTWLFAAFAIGAVAVTFHILFALFNSLQGFMIFVFYCALKKDIRKYWSSCWRCFREEGYPSSTTHSSSRKFSIDLPKGLFKAKGKDKKKQSKYEDSHDLKSSVETTDIGNHSDATSRENIDPSSC